MDLVLATHNSHKTREFVAMLGGRFQIKDLSAFPSISTPAETGRTFAENAILKAVGVAAQLVAIPRCDLCPAQRPFPAMVIAEDSGLEVDSLGCAPGIYSARFAGENATDEQNVEKLLKGLLGEQDRRARFRCVIAVVQNSTLIGTFEGATEGAVVGSPRGSGGFGYDPVFQPVGFAQTFAELPADTKNQISHRARAIGALLSFLNIRRLA